MTQDLGELKNPQVTKKTITALFLPGSGGAVSDCRIKVTAANACAELGFTWNEASSNCQMCEKMGGDWGSDNVCTFAASRGQ